MWARGESIGAQAEVISYVFRPHGLYTGSYLQTRKDFNMRFSSDWQSKGGRAHPFSEHPGDPSSTHPLLRRGTVRNSPPESGGAARQATGWLCAARADVRAGT